MFSEIKSEKFNALIKENQDILADRVTFSVGDGWYSLIENCIASLRKDINDGIDVKILQVKEKFGQLRFYISGGSASSANIIQNAERASLEICEFTGLPGILHKFSESIEKSGWIKTVNPEFAKNYRNKCQPEKRYFSLEDVRKHQEMKKVS